MNTNTTSSPVSQSAVDAILFFTFNHIAQTIDGSEKNFNLSGVYGSDQYKALMAAMALHPNYSLNPIAPTVQKRSYKGLTATLIRQYLEAKQDTAKLEKFNEMVKDKKAFGTIKSWFLDFYPSFNVAAAEKEIRTIKNKAARTTAQNNLKDVKAKYKPTVVTFTAKQAVNE